MRTGLARRGAAGRPLAAVACAVLCASLKTERALFFELLQMDAAIEPVMIESAIERNCRRLLLRDPTAVSRTEPPVTPAGPAAVHPPPHR